MHGPCPDGWDAEWSELSIFLWDVNPPERFGLVAVPYQRQRPFDFVISIIPDPAINTWRLTSFVLGHSFDGK